MNQKNNTIRVKVIGWFLLAALAVMLTGIISYNSYRDLLRSLEGTTLEETKLMALGEILVDITEAEAKMRAYALNRESTTLQEYQDLVLNIRQSLEQVKSIPPTDPVFNNSVDSVSLLLNNQTIGIEDFLELKQTLSQLDFPALALDEISNSSDSVPAVRTTTTTTTTTTKVEPILPEESDKNVKNTRRQQKKRAQEIAKELLKRNQEPLIETETTVVTDTSFVQPDTVLENIQQILVELGQEESRYQEVLAKKELLLVESSIRIIDQIRGLIGSLEKQELAANIKMANDAKLIASRSTLTISIIIFVCLILGILFTYLIFRDVRIRDFYNQRLIGEKNQAEQVAESKQQFLATMSHEIRTPLNAIIGFTEQLATTKLEPVQKQYLDAVETSSQHLLHTVNDILDYSKIEAGELKIARIPFEIATTIGEVTSALMIKAQEKGLELKQQVSPGKPITVLGDPHRLKQILFNLVSNGIKFTESGYVKVIGEYLKSTDTVKLTIKVEDSGIGIPEEKRKEIFSDFKQIDHSSTRKYQGTGLGLAICKRLVELQGGTIEVSTNQPKGTVFTVYLEYECSKSNSEEHTGLHASKVAKSNREEHTGLHTSKVAKSNREEHTGHTSQVAKSNSSNLRTDQAGITNQEIKVRRTAAKNGANPVSTKRTTDKSDTDAIKDFENLNILVADDDRFNIQLIKSLVEKWGAKATYCTDGKQAMSAFEKDAYQLILTDINMPEAGGVELSKFVRSFKDPEKNQIPIIALTANVMEDDLKRYRQAGINDFVLKPFREQELIQKINPIAVRHQSARSTASNGYNLDDFERFSGGDKAALRPMLETFHQSLKQNIEDMMEQAKQKNHHQVGELAHKMISSFGHLKALEPVNLLRELEAAIKSGASEESIERLVEKAWNISEPILEGLEQEIQALV